MKASLSFGKAKLPAAFAEQGGALSKPPTFSLTAVCQPPLLVCFQTRAWETAESDQRVERFEVGVHFRQIAEGAVHLEADLQVRLCVADVAEERLVAPHVVIINGLLQQRDRAGNQKVSCFRRFSELMQAKPGMEKPGAGIGGDAAELLADAQGEGPLLLSHEVMKAKLKHFRAILKARRNRVELRERFSRHAQLGVAAGGLQMPFKLHPPCLANTAPAAGFHTGEIGRLIH